MSQQGWILRFCESRRLARLRDFGSGTTTSSREQRVTVGGCVAPLRQLSNRRGRQEVTRKYGGGK